MCETNAIDDASVDSCAYTSCRESKGTYKDNSQANLNNKTACSCDCSARKDGEGNSILENSGYGADAHCVCKAEYAPVCPSGWVENVEDCNSCVCANDCGTVCDVSSGRYEARTVDGSCQCVDLCKEQGKVWCEDTQQCCEGACGAGFGNCSYNSNTNDEPSEDKDECIDDTNNDGEPSNEDSSNDDSSKSDGGDDDVIDAEFTKEQ